MVKKGGFLWKLFHDQEEAFKPFKFQEVIYYVIANIGRKLGLVELGNILYLIDYEWASITNTTLTEQRYYMGKWGPYNPYLKRVVERMDGHEIKITRIEYGKEGKYRSIHEVGSDPRFEVLLDKKEIEVIHKVFADVADLSAAKIKELVCLTEPVKAYLKDGEYQFEHGDSIDFSKR